MAKKKAKSKTGGVAGTPAKQRLQDAETAQQRGERRTGGEAISYFEQAARAYEEAIGLGLEANDHDNAIVLFADVLQQWAAQLLLAQATLPASQQSSALEVEAKLQAQDLLQRAVQVLSTLRDGQVAWKRADAAVNCGNCLADLAEHSNPEQAVRCLQLGVSAYSWAIAREPDALTWNNKADALMQLAQAESLSVTPDSARRASALVAEARAAYLQASMLSSSEEGDDLPGQLCNWGTGLTIAAGLSLRAGDGAAAARELIQDALGRLQLAVDLNRGDVQVPGALAEAYMVASACVAPGSDASVCERAGFLRKAMEATELALRIRADHGASLVTKAECHTAAAKLAEEAGSADERTAQLAMARGAYEAALRSPGGLGLCSDRCTVQYNYACVLVKCGELEGAVSELRGIAARDAGTLQGAEGDPDLGPLHAVPAFRDLFRNLP